MITPYNINKLLVLEIVNDYEGLSSFRSKVKMQCQVCYNPFAEDGDVYHTRLYILKIQTLSYKATFILTSYSKVLFHFRKLYSFPFFHGILCSHIFISSNIHSWVLITYKSHQIKRQVIVCCRRIYSFKFELFHLLSLSSEMHAVSGCLTYSPVIFTL